LFVAKLSTKSAPTRAACAAGLNKFLAIETVAPQAMVTLTSTNSQLLNVGKPDDKRQPRNTTTRSVP
jgi:hypothetical protein